MAGVKMISATEAWGFIQRGQGRLLDVREPGEFKSVRTPNTVNFPLSSLEKRVGDVASGSVIYVMCAVGGRAVAGAAILAEHGHDAFVVDGGIVEWRRRGLPVELGLRRVWAIDRQVRFVAGLVVLTGMALGWFVHPGYFLIATFVGAGLTFSGVTGFCGMAHVLARMPWNRA